MPSPVLGEGGGWLLRAVRDGGGAPGSEVGDLLCGRARGGVEAACGASGGGAVKGAAMETMRATMGAASLLARLRSTLGLGESGEPYSCTPRPPGRAGRRRDFQGALSPSPRPVREARGWGSGSRPVRDRERCEARRPRHAEYRERGGFEAARRLREDVRGAPLAGESTRPPSARGLAEASREPRARGRAGASGR